MNTTNSQELADRELARVLLAIVRTLLEDRAAGRLSDAALIEAVRALYTLAQALAGPQGAARGPAEALCSECEAHGRCRNPASSRLCPPDTCPACDKQRGM